VAANSQAVSDDYPSVSLHTAPVPRSPSVRLICLDGEPVVATDSQAVSDEHLSTSDAVLISGESQMAGYMCSSVNSGLPQANFLQSTVEVDRSHDAADPPALRIGFMPRSPSVCLIDLSSAPENPFTQQEVQPAPVAAVGDPLPIHDHEDIPNLCQPSEAQVADIDFIGRRLTNLLTESVEVVNYLTARRSALEQEHGMLAQRLLAALMHAQIE